MYNRRLILKSPISESSTASYLMAFDTIAYGTFKFYISSAKSGTFKIDWGDSIIEVLNVGISSTTITHIYKTYGSKKIQILESSVNLTYLGVYSCLLQNLDISNNQKLKKLYCYTNNLTKLDISKNIELDTLYCYNNKLTELDLSKNAKLTSLNCYSNSLRKLDIRPCLKMTSLYCYNNTISELEMGGSYYLQYLYCYNNQITKLDLDYAALRDLIAYNNQLTNIDVSKTTTVSNIQIYGNKLTSLNVVNNGPLVTLLCHKNNLSGELNVINNSKLTTFNCSDNKLNNIVLTGAGRSSSTLTDFNLSGNLLTQNCLNDVLVKVNTYYGKPSKKSLIINRQTPVISPSGEGLIAKTSLTSKGWIITI